LCPCHDKPIATRIPLTPMEYPSPVVVAAVAVCQLNINAHAVKQWPMVATVNHHPLNSATHAQRKKRILMIRYLLILFVTLSLPVFFTCCSPRATAPFEATGTDNDILDTYPIHFQVLSIQPAWIRANPTNTQAHLYSVRPGLAYLCATADEPVEILSLNVLYMNAGEKDAVPEVSYYVVPRLYPETGPARLGHLGDTNTTASPGIWVTLPLKFPAPIVLDYEEKLLAIANSLSSGDQLGIITATVRSY